MKKLLPAAQIVTALLLCWQCMESLLAQTSASHDVSRRNATLRSLHFQGSARELLQKALALYGLEVVLEAEDKFPSQQLRVDVDDADLATAGTLLGALTHSTLVPLDAHVILAVPHKPGSPLKTNRVVTATLPVTNLTAASGGGKAVSELLSGVFGDVKASPHGNSVVIEGSPDSVEEAREVLTELDRPQPQILLEVKAYTISKTHNTQLGVQPPQSIAVFNVYTAAESLLSSNSSIVAELIQEGLASAGDTLAIAELLIAGGYAGSSVLGSPSLYFGGGKTAMGVQFDSVQANAALSESTVRELQEVHLQLADRETGKFRVGQRYPVLTSTSAVLGSTSSGSVTPSFEYEDLGLTLEANAHLEGDYEVLMHLHETIRSLAGNSLNDIPILDNQEVSTDLTVPAGVTTVLVSNLSRSEVHATQGVFGWIPSQKSMETTDSQLLITITPVITRAFVTKTSPGR